MVDVDHIIGGITQAAIKYFLGKKIEINTGESKTVLHFNDFQESQRSVIRGYLVEVIGDALVVECSINNVTQTVVINSYNVISIIELKGNGTTKDIYCDEYKRQKK